MQTSTMVYMIINKTRKKLCNKMKIRLTLRILWGLCCLLLLSVNTVDFVQFTKQPELYPIGSEGLWWAYESYNNYVLVCLLAIGWDIAGLIASVCYRVRYSGKILMIHFVLTLGLLLYFRIYITI